MEAGDTFKYGRRSHLWIVVSDPQVDRAEVVIANMTTDDGVDPSCILDAGDHPFVQHRTCIRYDMARIVRDADLERHVASNTIRLHERVSADILERIRQGAAASPYIPFGCKQVLIDQGLIEP
jgi:hypothetical protein